MTHSSTKHPRQPVETGEETITPLAEEAMLPELTAESSGAALPETGEVPVSREEHEQLKAERDQLLDRLARLQAEFDNARKREARERTEFRDYALVSTVEQFLPVLDNFQLALRADGSAEQLRAGVELIVRQMEEVLRSLGVRPVATQDALFDPRLHEALEMVEREDMPDHQIMEEVRRGYTLRDRLLRPALVRVASNPKQHTA
jgi:molecular chaperone GrpE